MNENKELTEHLEVQENKHGIKKQEKKEQTDSLESLKKQNLFEDIETFFVMAKNILLRKYKMPWVIILWPLAFVLYLISPLDFMPDFIPVLGFGDDAVFFLFIISRIRKETSVFRLWQTNKNAVLEEQNIKTTKGGRR